MRRGQVTTVTLSEAVREEISIAQPNSDVECYVIFTGFLRNSREDASSMNRVLKTLRVVQWSMLASILLYAALGQVLGRGVRAVDPAVSYLFSTLAVAIVGIIFVVRRTLVMRAADSLATRPDDGISLEHWRTGYLATYALCEALALFGLVLRFLGSGFQQSALFYIGGFALLFFFGPRQPVSAESAPGA